MVKSRLTFSNAVFRCHLECGRCIHIKGDGQRCRNRVCFGMPICWVHTKAVYGIRLRESTIVGAGKGLFATIPFAAGAYICPYVGERITEACLNERYPGNMTAPYAVTDNGRHTDSACLRGIGAMSNGLFKVDGSCRAERFHNSEIVSRRGRGLWLRATKNIPAGAEILTYYGDEYKLEADHSTKRSSRAENKPC